MKKIYQILVIIAVSAGAFSCRKEKSISQSQVATLLSSKTWVFDEVTDYEPGEQPIRIYKRGASFNLIDMSKIEHTFIPGGEYQYKDEEGQAGTGRWKLLGNDSKLELTINSGESQIFTDLAVSVSACSLKLTGEENAYSTLKMIPKQ